jgi:hypothetical protein
MLQQQRQQQQVNQLSVVLINTMQNTPRSVTDTSKNGFSGQQGA